MKIHIESLLSARLFLSPQIVNNRIYFISNISGHLSLFAMDYGGSIPEPLLPPEIALQNPHLVNGNSFYVFPNLGKIIVMLDKDGDEKYQPMLIPIDGGYPEPMLNDIFTDFSVFLTQCDIEKDIAYFVASSRKEAKNDLYQVNLTSNTPKKIFESQFGGFPSGINEDHTKVVIIEGYSLGDHLIHLWDSNEPRAKLLYGVPLSERKAGETVPINNIHSCHFTKDETHLFFHTTLFDDRGGLAYFNLQNPSEIKPVKISGETHKGVGEINSLEHLHNNHYLLSYNIDGCDWLYEGVLDNNRWEFQILYTITGKGTLANGVVEHCYYEKKHDRFILSFSSATSPTQIYTISGKEKNNIIQHTRERILGIPSTYLSAGEDASYISFDGTRISARLYFPPAELGFQGPRPLVYYIHGGPQSQERPDFTWFSMPLIQLLAMSGFAVFVPNVRGSTGYGLNYTKKVDRDWGGDDRLDHVHAMTKFLPFDKRIDVTRSGVVGRSYGGYMTLTLAARHPSLWKAAIDMFGPYDLITFSERIPETWKPYFAIALGDPNTKEGRAFLKERSPRTYIEQITCPLLVIQGKNDPRVVEQESRDLVEYLRSIGKEVTYLVFEDEGHDVLKFKNRVRVYNEIKDYFTKYLKP